MSVFLRTVMIESGGKENKMVRKNLCTEVQRTLDVGKSCDFVARSIRNEA